MKGIKIASIGYTHEGGAGLSSMKLHQEFLNQGHESRFYVIHKKLNLKEVYRLKVREKSEKINTVPIKNDKVNIFNSGMSIVNEDTLEGVYEWADVILLRWVTGAISDWQIGRWSYKSKPVIWCLSDMEPFTGGCHYSEGCTGYENECNNCHIVDPNFKFLPKLGVKRKSLWGDLVVVSPSYWLYECSKKSTVFKNKDVKVIRTGIELNVFKPYDKNKSRDELDLPRDKKIVFIASHSISDPRKGLDLFQDSLVYLKNNFDISQFVFVTAGHNSIYIDDVSHVHLGYISDRSQLAKIYSASDLTALPYREDNLPNVLLESIACGTPVCSFDIGGMPDVIIDGFNGFLIPPYNTRIFSEKIYSILENNFNSEEIREWSLSNLDIKDQASNYIKLFLEKMRIGQHSE